MSENKDYRHSRAASFAGHQVDLTQHRDDGTHVANVRHPEYHGVIHSTEPHRTQAEALLAAKRWIHTRSPQAYRSRRGGNLFKAEEEAIAAYVSRNETGETQ